MEKKFRLLLLLALLMTAATGAWAQDAKHLITATYREQTRSLEQPLPYATSIGELYEAVSGQSFSDLISSMSSVGMPLTGITSRNTSIVSIGEFNGASTPVTVIADGETIINLIFGSYVQGIPVSATSPLYAYMKDGVKDADKWTVKVDDGQAQALPIGGLKGDGSETVTLKYTGRLKVKGVKATSDEKPAAPTGKTVDLSTLTADYEAQDGETLTGTLAGNYKISIADGATVTLDGVTINGVNDGNYEWAGITCLGDATIILSGTNTVKGFYEDYPGIQAAADKTLIINGTGSLTASNYGYAAAIGGGNKVACGNIEIQGGTITATTGGRVAGIGGGHNASCGNITISGGTVTATGGTNGAGIGGGYNASWGNITISGGTVNATGGEYGAGIGGGKRGAASFSCGNIIISGGTVTATGGNNAPGIGGGRGNNNKTFSSCGTITIANTVTKVTATKGENAPNSIGAGYYGNCGTVTIGGTVYWQNNAAVNGGDTYLAQSPLIYDPAAPTYTLLSAATTSDYGKVVCAAGHLHDAKTAVPTGCTAVGILGKVTETGHGLILTLKNATNQNWNTINGWKSVTTYAGTTLKVLPNDAARGTNLTSYTKLGETTVSNWAVAQKSDYAAIFTNLGSATGHSSGKTYDGNVNAYITTGVGGTAISGNYWSATENEEDDAWYFGSSSWDAYPRDENQSVRPVLGF